MSARIAIHGLVLSVLGLVLSVLGVVLWIAPPATGAPLILNEFNAVSSSGFLNGGTASTDGDGNSVDPPADTYFGRIAGNGGDWVELVVVADHLDIRGWMLDICEGVVCDDQLVFAIDPVWSDLRAGTVITVAEDEPTDLSFNPGGGDYWMNVRAHNGGSGTYITASNFPVSNNDWNLTIRDDTGALIFGPLGEHVPVTADCSPPQDDVNSGEIFRLEQAPTALIDPCFLSLNDWEDGVLSTFGEENQWNGGTASQSFANLQALAPYPDRDGDQIPDDGDLSGVAGDSACVGGNTTGCDDNCAGIQNPLQADTGGPGGADGQGDSCQCGDPTGDDDTTAADLLEMRELRVGLRSELTVPERCSVHSLGQCTLSDVVVLSRTLANPALEPGLAPTCQVAALHTDQSEFMFEPERLLEIDVRIDEGDWDMLRVEELDVLGYIPFDPLCGTAPWRDFFEYNFYPADVTVDGQTLTNVAVRKKGFFGSLSETMPSLKVKFDEFVGGQQLNDMDRLTLNNNLQDPAHVKQCLSYKLMREAGVPAPRCNFSHLTVTTVNGMTETTAVDLIYSHVESIKDPFLRRHFGSDTDQGRLYEGTLSDFWSGSFRNTIEPKTQSAMDDTTEIDALVAALEGNLSEAARLAAIEGLVDVDDFLTFWAAEGLVGHWDGYQDDQNNFWFYVDPADGLIRFIPWGTDDTWGQGNPLQLRTGDPVHAEAIVPRAALARRLYEISTTNTQYLARLQSLMDDVYDETEIHAEIDRIETLITPVAGSLTSALAPIRTWVDAHRASVNAEIMSPTAGFGGQPTHFCIFGP